MFTSKLPRTDVVLRGMAVLQSSRMWFSVENMRVLVTIYLYPTPMFDKVHTVFPEYLIVVVENVPQLLPLVGLISG